LHGLSDDGVVYGQQNPAVIDQGVFHNDVIAVGNGEVLFYHEDAFLETEQMLAELQASSPRSVANSSRSAFRVPL
jgi:succinylarginine dihydrolase